jgi:hypothetical protein
METRSACRDAHDAACMLSTWLQRTRRLPCLALTLCCQPSPASSLPFVRARALAVSPEMLARLLRTLGLHCALSLVLVHRSWRLKLMHPPPPPTSPVLHPASAPSPPSCALVRSQVGFGAASSMGSASGGKSRKPLSDGHKVHLWRYEAPEGLLSRLCCRRLLRPGDLLALSSIQGHRAGTVVSCCLCLMLPHVDPGVLLLLSIHQQ